MKKAIFTLFAIGWLALAQAQIQAPNLICVTTRSNGNVELQWQLPAPNPCGAFNGYRIYASQNLWSPFSLLTVVTNPSQTTYVHQNANGTNTTWYYYMNTDLTCPTLQLLQSDILDNLDPETPPIQSVSINDANHVEVKWEVSPSLETAAYIIYRETNSGFVPIDTTFGRFNTSFEDVGVNISQPQTYTIAAMDACGNTGLLYPMPHQTILLDVNVNRCDQTIELIWDGYDSWANPVAAYQVRTRVNGGNRTLAATVTGSLTDHALTNFADGDQVCITVQAVELFTGHASSTNEVCVTSSIVEPLEYFYLSNVTINNYQQVEIFWNWDVDADLQRFTIEQQRDTNFILLAQENTAPPLFPINYYLLDSASVTTDTNSLVIRLSATDSCNVTTYSTLARTVFLTGFADADYKNLLSWSPFEMPFATVQNYLIYRIVEGESPVLAATVNASTFSYEDQVNGYDGREANIRYYVVAQSFLELPDGTTKEILSQSNTILIRQLTKIFMPNAFYPEGINSNFRPKMVFAENSQFSMVIYNRWGEKVFETTNPSEGWDGRRNGLVMRQGVYTYVVRVTQLNGSPIEQRGTVLLLR